MGPSTGVSRSAAKRYFSHAGAVMFLGAITMVLSACSQTLNKEPDLPGSTSVIISNTKDTSSGDVPAECSASDVNTNAASRNSCVSILLARIDGAFYAYRTRTIGGTSVFRLGADTVSLGLSAAGSLAPGATLKAILAATDTAVKGFSGDVDKEVFYNSSLDVLFAQMKKDRATILQNIYSRMKLPIPTSTIYDPTTTYSMEAARQDLVNYYNAGTLPSAIVSLSGNVNGQATTAQEQANTANQPKSPQDAAIQNDAAQK